MDSVLTAVRRLTRGRGEREPDKQRCQICLARATASRVVRSRRTGRKMTVKVCRRCGYVEMPDNTHDYTASTSVENLGLAARCGTLDRTGREFGMAQLGVEVLARPDLSVLVYGVGRSLDNRHICELPEVERVAIGDIMKIRDDAEFIDIRRPATERFDIVVASEVIEHFENPRAEFRRLFGYVEFDGVLICSTNIYDGGRLGRQGYIFGRGHVSYYTPEALRSIATDNRMRVDFRVPLSATGMVGGRKRYVIFSRSNDVMDSVSDYFGRHTYAPSEEPQLTPRRASHHEADQEHRNPTGQG